MSSSNMYLRYRRNSGRLSGWNAFVAGILVAFFEVCLRGFALGGGERCSDGDFGGLLFPEMLRGVCETPWANFSDVLSVLTFLAAAAIGVFVAGGSIPNAKNDNSARGRASGVSRVDLADKAIEYCTFFVAAYLWRTLILTSAKIPVVVLWPEGSVREKIPDLIIFGALAVGILGCRWINRVLIPGLHVLRLDLEEMERRKWRLALLDAELTRSLKLDCGVGKHVVPLAGEHSRCVWIIRWLPVVRVLLSVLFFGVLFWVSPIYLGGQDEEKTAWMTAKAAVGFVAPSEFVELSKFVAVLMVREAAWMIAKAAVGLVVLFEFAALLTDKDRHVERCLRCFVEGSLAPLWRILVSDHGLLLIVIPVSGLMSWLIILFGDHETLFLGALSLAFVIWHVAVSFVAAMPRMHRKEGVWDASWWTELKEWKERGLGNVSPEQALCALVLQDYMRAEAGGRFKWLRSPITWVRKSHGPAGKSMESMKNQIEKDCALLADAIEDMGGRKPST